jgi:hypothetical protein
MAKPKPPPAHVRTHDELVQELREQLTALGQLSVLFHSGQTWAAKLMATVLYVICHDGRDKTRSLLTQLGIRDQLSCISTALPVRPGNILTIPLMLGFTFGPNHTGQVPRFEMPDMPPFPRVPFSEWWEQAVYSLGDQNIITRKELVLAVRSKDGGGHFDSELDCANYVNMKAGAGWFNLIAGEEQPPDPSHLITVYAMGWELYHSLAEYDEQQRQSRPEGA